MASPALKKVTAANLTSLALSPRDMSAKVREMELEGRLRGVKGGGSGAAHSSGGEGVRGGGEPPTKRRAAQAAAEALANITADELGTSVVAQANDDDDDDDEPEGFTARVGGAGVPGSTGRGPGRPPRAYFAGPTMVGSGARPLPPVLHFPQLQPPITWQPAPDGDPAAPPPPEWWQQLAQRLEAILAVGVSAAGGAPPMGSNVSMQQYAQQLELRNQRQQQQLDAKDAVIRALTEEVELMRAANAAAASVAGISAQALANGTLSNSNVAKYLAVIRRMRSATTQLQIKYSRLATRNMRLHNANMELRARLDETLRAHGAANGSTALLMPDDEAAADEEDDGQTASALQAADSVLGEGTAMNTSE